MFVCEYSGKYWYYSVGIGWEWEWSPAPAHTNTNRYALKEEEGEEVPEYVRQKYRELMDEKDAKMRDIWNDPEQAEIMKESIGFEDTEPFPVMPDSMDPEQWDIMYEQNDGRHEE